MPECYLCGDYIAKGEGYRRRVLTGSSTRIYSGRRSGGSYGESYGTRTVCRICAKLDDKSSQGRSLLTLLYLGLYGFSIYVGYLILTAPNGIGQPLKGLLLFALVIGLPVRIIGSVIECLRREAITREILSEESANFELAGDRLQFEERNIKLQNTEYPHLITPKKQILRVKDTSEPLDTLSHTSGIRDGESVDAWITRISRSPNALDDTADMLHLAVQFVTPKIGEPLDHFFQRATTKLNDVLYLNTPGSGLQPDESVNSWVARIIPELVAFCTDTCADNVTVLLGRMAQAVPPMPNETALEWFLRVRISTNKGNKVYEEYGGEDIQSDSVRRSWYGGIISINTIKQQTPLANRAARVIGLIVLLVFAILLLPRLIMELKSASSEQSSALTSAASLRRVSAPQELNVREGPGSNYRIIRKLYFNQLVSVSKTVNGWSFIGDGWVRSKFLDEPAVPRRPE